jgi:predicted transposase/invertase (TIGR01784 family)
MNNEHNQKQESEDSANASNERPKHDELFKKVMSEPVAAREFLEHYLPSSFKNKIDLNSVKIEKESFITEDLRKRLSDVVYSVSLKQGKVKDGNTDSTSKNIDNIEDVDNEKAYVYVLIEHQSSSDYWISFRLWQYMLLLCERHKDNTKEKSKLPLICPIVVYANDKPYNAPRSLWELFEDSQTAKALMSDEYLLVDLQKQSDDEIVNKKHLGMMEYMLKHIKARDILNLWQSLLERFESSIEIDKANDYIYIKWLLWYSDAKVAEDKQAKLASIIAKHLNKADQEGLMRTIADKYIDEGVQKGMVQGMQIGEAKGKYEVAKNMLSNNYSISEISRITGLSLQDINALLKS